MGVNVDTNALQSKVMSDDELSYNKDEGGSFIISTNTYLLHGVE
jgi:hypothetical protein